MLIKSPADDVAIEEVSLTRFILGFAAKLGEKPALIDGPSGRTVTFRQLADDSTAVAAGLSDLGFGKGDVLAIFSPNRPEYAVAYYAAVRLGGIVSTVNALYTTDEVAFQLNDAGAKFLLTDPQLLKTATEAVLRSDVKDTFVFEEAEGAASFDSLSRVDATVPEVEVRMDDVVALPYSSGTTGLPKGVMLTHRNLVSNMQQMVAVHRVSQDDVLIAVLPMFHIYGQQVIMNQGLSQGATLVSMPRFDLEGFLRLVQEHRVTRAYLVPPIVLALAKHPMIDEFDLSSLRIIIFRTR